jgi:hypothetical protein
MKSKMPIMASTLAAPTAGRPKSAQSGMKCVWISPLVLAPQMKKLANRIQNTRVRAASRNAVIGENSAAAKEDVVAGGGAAGAVSP